MFDSPPTEDEYRNLVERSHMIEQLTQHPGWEYFVDRAVVTIAAVQKRVLSGAAQTIEDYREDIGFLRGAQAVLAVPQTVAAATATARQMLEEANQP